MNDIISTIETFPNELLLELFEYIAPYDLYNIFYNINSRFKSIVSSCRNLHLILEEDWDNKERSAPFFASNVSSLIVKHDEPIDFSNYSNIRSLKLCMPTENQCNAIQPDLFFNLEHLCISNLYYSDNSEQLSRFIFSTKFLHLRTCHIDRINLNDNHRDISLTLHQITLSPSTWKSNMYKQIFNSCPNLSYLQLIRLRNISFEISATLKCPHSSLRYLYIHCYSIEKDWYNHIDWLLSNIPNLENLKLLIDENQINFELFINSLAYLLTQHLSRLSYFKAKIPLNHVLGKDLNVIKQLHPLFTHIRAQKRHKQNSNSYLIISSEM